MTNSAQRLIAKVLRELGQTQRFTSCGDLRVALRERLNRLGIRYEPHEFDDAFSTVSSNARLVVSAVDRAAHRRVAAENPDARPLNRHEAQRVFADLRTRFPQIAVKPL